MEAQEKEENKALKEVEQGREARQQLITQVLETMQLTSTFSGEGGCSFGDAGEEALPWVYS